MSVASKYSFTLIIKDLESRLPIFHPGPGFRALIKNEKNGQKGHNGSRQSWSKMIKYGHNYYYNATRGQNERITELKRRKIEKEGFVNIQRLFR